jgi:hypothetical protein
MWAAALSPPARARGRACARRNSTANHARTIVSTPGMGHGCGGHRPRGPPL